MIFLVIEKIASNESASNGPLLTDPLSEAITTPGDAGSCFKSELRFPTSFFQQFFILLGRTFVILSRDRTLTYSRIFIHLLISVFIGILYYRIGDDATYMKDNFNYLFFSIMFLMFTAFSSMTLTCKYPSIFASILFIHIYKEVRNLNKQC